MACVSTKSIAHEHENVDCVVAMTKASFTLTIVLVKKRTRFHAAITLPLFALAT